MQFCACGIGQHAQNWLSCAELKRHRNCSFAGFVQQYRSQFDNDGRHSQRKACQCKSNEIKQHQNVQIEMHTAQNYTVSKTKEVTSVANTVVQQLF